MGSLSDYQTITNSKPLIVSEEPEAPITVVYNFKRGFYACLNPGAFHSEGVVKFVISLHNVY